ncbi:F-box/kelch-repeat protein At3g61590-like [Silene latifolia]|uniref:F-box/kelch-repeat protein At3g61590-like n=1 Tax=Silene latifolia TaxID=37657 RepID=UPI003D776063
MDRNAWVTGYQCGTPFKVDSLSDINDELNKDMVSIDSILPDDLLEKILASLPIASIFRAGCVCKRWHEIVISKRFLWNFSLNISSHKPWYFMFTSTDESRGFSYDPALKKWYSIELPRFVTSNWFNASSFGLVCFMNNDNRNELYVCNPVTKSSKRLIEPPGIKFSDYSALAISVNKMSHNYNVSIVKSKQVPGNFYEWDLSIHVYSSETMKWVTSLSEVLNGWRSGDESVICDDVLYFLLYSTRRGTLDHRHGLIHYKLSNCSSEGLLMKNLIPTPCSLTCGRLMNLKGNLVMVGGIEKHERPDIIKGIGIWVLNGTKWEEIARMPHKYFQGFGEFDDVFASSGIEDVIYIQSYGAPALLLFDMNHKQWRWSQKCPVTKRFPLQLFTGFCYEPRLEVSP